MKMNNKINILLILFFLPFSICSQAEIDSSQKYEIRYFYEQIYSDSDYELFKTKLLSRTNTTKDSLQITEHVNELKEIQQVRLDNDTNQTCKIIFSGEPIEFNFIIDGKEFKFNKDDFKNTKIPDDYPNFEDQCQIAILRKTDKTINARYESNTLSYDCKLNLSFSTIKIEHNLNIPMSTEISTKPDPNGGPPIPTEKIIIVEGAIEIEHKWSN